MTDLDLMRLCAARSTAAQRGALDAIRAIRVDSPIIARRVARVAEAALLDSAADWSDDERAWLAEACARPAGAPLADDPPRDRLSALVATWEAAGESQAAFAELLGVDARTLTRWLIGELAIPGSRARMLARVLRIDQSPERVTLVMTR